VRNRFRLLNSLLGKWSKVSAVSYELALGNNAVIRFHVVSVQGAWSFSFGEKFADERVNFFAKVNAFVHHFQ
jgi:hypothetical protein